MTLIEGPLSAHRNSVGRMRVSPNNVVIRRHPRSRLQNLFLARPSLGRLPALILTAVRAVAAARSAMTDDVSSPSNALRSPFRDWAYGCGDQEHRPGCASALGHAEQPDDEAG